MKILVTGGSGLIGKGVIPKLEEHGHSVRLLSRHANDGFKGDVADAESIRGAADGCDAVLHIAGIVEEAPPERTFARVNAGGTRNIIAECERAGVRRFVFVSSLGADRGTSAYHQSKREAETAVERSSLAWTIVRPGSVFGPGDAVISLILQLVRSLPAVPVVDRGDQRFQPIWFEDLGEALARIVERDDLARRTLEVGGAEVTSMNDLLERFRSVTGRQPLRVPVPAAVASLGMDVNKLTMLREENVLSGDNALDLLGITPTPLDAALQRLADVQPENIDSGVGKLEYKRYTARIEGSRMNATELMSWFRAHIGDTMPVDVEGHALNVGNMLTISLPLRGDVQVRVEIVEPTRIVLATIAGHPLAGIVEFSTRGNVEFAIDIHARSANVFDYAAMHTVGKFAQHANWLAVMQRVIEASGGTAPEGVQSTSEKLTDEEERKAEQRMHALVGKPA